MFRRFFSVFILVAFLTNTIISPALAQNLVLPAPGTMITPSAAFTPVLMKGLKVHPDNPLLFDFIVDTGKSGLPVDGAEFKSESQKLIKYFLASLTIKEEDLWVNLSPYEKDRMLTEELGQTELGRDMLAQDYLLKQLTASLIYPEKSLGKKFWDKVYALAAEKFGTTDVPVDTFNKVWITADKAKVVEKNDAAYVVGAHLKVMLESDYVASERSNVIRQTSYDGEPNAAYDVNRMTYDSASSSADLSKQVLREVIVPAIETEVNEGANFAPLRQMFYSMILASWYKLALKDALLNQVYANQGKTAGVLTDDPAEKEKIYQQYLEAYKQGVFNYVKEETDVQQETIPRKYFSGGLQLMPDPAQMIERAPRVSFGDAIAPEGDLAMISTQVMGKPGDVAIRPQGVSKRVSELSLDDLQLTARANKVLSDMRITTVDELVALTWVDLFKQRNFGRKTLSDLRRKLERHGLSLRDDPPAILSLDAAMESAPDMPEALRAEAEQFIDAELLEMVSGDHQIIADMVTTAVVHQALKSEAQTAEVQQKEDARLANVVKKASQTAGLEVRFDRETGRFLIDEAMAPVNVVPVEHEKAQDFYTDYRFNKHSYKASEKPVLTSPDGTQFFVSGFMRQQSTASHPILLERFDPRSKVLVQIDVTGVARHEAVFDRLKHPQVWQRLANSGRFFDQSDAEQIRQAGEFMLAEAQLVNGETGSLPTDEKAGAVRQAAFGRFELDVTGERAVFNILVGGKQESFFTLINTDRGLEYLLPGEKTSKVLDANGPWLFGREGQISYGTLKKNGQGQIVFETQNRDVSISDLAMRTVHKERFYQGGVQVTVVTVDRGKVDVNLRVDEDVLNRDFISDPVSAEKISGLGSRVKDYVDAMPPGERKDLLAVFNGVNGNFWTPDSGLIIDGRLISKAKGARGVFQDNYAPMNGRYWVFSLDADQPELFEIEINNGELPPGLGVNNGLLAAPLIMNGKVMLDELKFGVRPSVQGHEIMWPRDQRHPLSAIGYDKDRNLIRVAMVGESEAAQPTVDELVLALQQAGAVDAVILGASADVQDFVSEEGAEEFSAAPGRPGSMTAKLFPDGRPVANYIEVRRKPNAAADSAMNLTFTVKGWFGGRVSFPTRIVAPGFRGDFFGGTIENQQAITQATADKIELPFRYISPGVIGSSSSFPDIMLPLRKVDDKNWDLYTGYEERLTAFIQKHMPDSMTAVLSDPVLGGWENQESMERAAESYGEASYVGRLLALSAAAAIALGVYSCVKPHKAPSPEALSSMQVDKAMTEMKPSFGEMFRQIGEGLREGKAPRVTARWMKRFGWWGDASDAVETMDGPAGRRYLESLKNRDVVVVNSAASFVRMQGELDNSGALLHSYAVMMNAANGALTTEDALQGTLTAVDAIKFLNGDFQILVLHFDARGGSRRPGDDGGAPVPAKLKPVPPTLSARETKDLPKDQAMLTPEERAGLADMLEQAVEGVRKENVTRGIILLAGFIRKAENWDQLAVAYTESGLDKIRARGFLNRGDPLRQRIATLIPAARVKELRDEAITYFAKEMLTPMIEERVAVLREIPDDADFIDLLRGLAALRPDSKKVRTPMDPFLGLKVTSTDVFFGPLKLSKGAVSEAIAIILDNFRIDTDDHGRSAITLGPTMFPVPAAVKELRERIGKSFPELERASKSRVFVGLRQHVFHNKPLDEEAALIRSWLERLKARVDSAMRESDPVKPLSDREKTAQAKALARDVYEFFDRGHADINVSEEDARAVGLLDYDPTFIKNYILGLRLTAKPMISYNNEIHDEYLKALEVLGTRVEVTDGVAHIEVDFRPTDSAMAKLAGKRVLVVEDYPSVLEALVDLWKDTDAEVVAADRGDVALAKVEGVDLIVTDFQMPGLDGIGLIQAVRKKGLDVPVFIQSTDPYLLSKELKAAGVKFESAARPGQRAQVVVVDKTADGVVQMAEEILLPLPSARPRLDKAMKAGALTGWPEDHWYDAPRPVNAGTAIDYMPFHSDADQVEYFVQLPEGYTRHRIEEDVLYAVGLNGEEQVADVRRMGKRFEIRSYVNGLRVASMLHRGSPGEYRDNAKVTVIKYSDSAMMTLEQWEEQKAELRKSGGWIEWKPGMKLDKDAVLLTRFGIASVRENFPDNRKNFLRLRNGEDLPEDEYVEGRIFVSTADWAMARNYLRGKRILVVDDNDNDVALARFYFGHFYSEVIVARDGKEALELSRQHKFDAILTDTDMPRMNGIHFLQALQSEQPDIPVIIWSGNYDNLVKELAKAKIAVNEKGEFEPGKPGVVAMSKDRTEDTVFVFNKYFETSFAIEGARYSPDEVFTVFKAIEKGLASAGIKILPHTSSSLTVGAVIPLAREVSGSPLLKAVLQSEFMKYPGGVTVGKDSFVLSFDADTGSVRVYTGSINLPPGTEDISAAHSKKIGQFISVMQDWARHVIGTVNNPPSKPSLALPSFQEIATWGVPVAAPASRDKAVVDRITGYLTFQRDRVKKSVSGYLTGSEELTSILKVVNHDIGNEERARWLLDTCWLAAKYNLDEQSFVLLQNNITNVLSATGFRTIDGKDVPPATLAADAGRLYRRWMLPKTASPSEVGRVNAELTDHAMIAPFLDQLNSQELFDLAVFTGHAQAALQEAKASSDEEKFRDHLKRLLIVDVDRYSRELRLQGRENEVSVPDRVERVVDYVKQLKKAAERRTPDGMRRIRSLTFKSADKAIQQGDDAMVRLPNDQLVNGVAALNILAQVAAGLERHRASQVDGLYFLVERFGTQDNLAVWSKLARDTRWNIGENFVGLARGTLTLDGEVETVFAAWVKDQQEFIRRSLRDSESHALEVGKSDDAMQNERLHGGIEFNGKKLGLDVNRKGSGAIMQFDEAMVEEFRRGNFSGVEGVILKITPVPNALGILGLE